VLVVALAAVVVLTVCVAGVGRPTQTPDDRPAHLLDLPLGSIDRIDVREPATRRTGHRVGGTAGSRQLEGDLAPLLAIRVLDHRRPDYGLDPPRLEVTVTAGGRTVHLLVGARNFDGTAVYVGVGTRTALVLPRIATALAAVVDQAEP
jgi:hypothetical protein